MNISLIDQTSSRKVFIITIIIIVNICMFLAYKFFVIDYQQRLMLPKNTAWTICEVVSKTTDSTVNYYIEYTVNGKQYVFDLNGKSLLKEGEYYKIKYSRSHPEISELDHKSPLVFDIHNYEPMNAVVTNTQLMRTYDNEPLNFLSFVYQYGNEEYKRTVLLNSLEGLCKEKEIEILINMKHPEIAYLKQQISAN